MWRQEETVAKGSGYTADLIIQTQTGFWKPSEQMKRMHDDLLIQAMKLISDGTLASVLITLPPMRLQHCLVAFHRFSIYWSRD